MATKKKMLMSAAGSAGGAGLDIDEVFSTYLYEGDGDASPISLNNGIDLLGEGGLIWVKKRNQTGNHYLHDTSMVSDRYLSSNNDFDLQGGVHIYPNSTGFTSENKIQSNFNYSGDDFVSWTFRKAPKFFDVQTWTGTGGGNRSISHSLESVPASVFVKSTTETSDWVVYHKDADGDLNLNSSDAQHYADASSVSMPSSDYNSITYNPQNGSLVASRLYQYNGTGNSVQYSLDGGSSWTSVSTGISGSASNIQMYSYANGYHYLGVQDNGGTNTYKLLYSANGSSWSAAISSSSNLPFDSVRYSKNLGLYFLTAQNIGYYWTSTDGVSWTQRNYPSGVSNMLGGATESTLIIFKRGTSSTYYTSTDGINWTSRTSPYGNNYHYFASSNGDTNNENSAVFINVFRNSPRYSYDGITWSSLGYLGSNSAGVFDATMHYANGWYYYMNNLGYLMRTNIGSNVQVTTQVSSWYAAEEYIGVVYSGTLSKISASKSTTSVTDSVIRVNNNINNLGEEYVAYLFAHNDGDGEFGPDGDQDIIKCGSYTGNGSTNGPEIDLGFEPQWVMIKRTDSGSVADWILLDTMRGMPVGGTDVYLRPNNSSSEVNVSGRDVVDPQPTGFQVKGGNINAWNASGGTYIYMAIRRGPLAAPESATEVFAIDTKDGTSSLPSWKSGFTTDLFLYRDVDAVNVFRTAHRLTYPKTLQPTTTSAESNTNAFDFDHMDGVGGYTNANTTEYGWMWKRAPNFFDVVAYTGNGTAGRTVSHNLGVAPEMMWVKSRSDAYSWIVYSSYIPNSSTNRLLLEGTSPADSNTNIWWNSTDPAADNFTLGNGLAVNKSGSYYIAYLFASLPGISKVGSYTGTGNTLNVDCGFTSGARFVFIKAADDSGSWYMVDSARGIVAGEDPTLRLEDTGAEFDNKDWIDPYSAGFTITSTAGTSFNASGITYIFYAIA